MTRTQDITAELLAPEPELPGASLAALVDEVLERARAGRAIVDALPVGLELLADSGLPRGELVALAGAPGCGKSLLADRLVVDTLRMNPSATAVVLALETAPPVRMARLLAGLTVAPAGDGSVGGIPVTPLLRGGLQGPGLARIEHAGAELVDLIGGRLRFVDSARRVADIAALLRAETPSVALLDHIGLVEPEPGENGIEAQDRALGALLDAAREAGTSLIVIAEVNKQSLRAGGYGLDSLRGSARLASLASAVLVLERVDDDDGGEAAKDPAVRLLLLKNRHGRAGTQQVGTLFGGYACVRLLPGAKSIEHKKRKRARAEA